MTILKKKIKQVELNEKIISELNEKINNFMLIFNYADSELITIYIWNSFKDRSMLQKSKIADPVNREAKLTQCYKN